MKTIVIHLRDDSYETVKRIINDINKEPGVIEIIEKQNYTYNKEKLLSLLKNKTIKVFEDINNPIQWQKKQREEWN